MNREKGCMPFKKLWQLIKDALVCMMPVEKFHRSQTYKESAQNVNTWLNDPSNELATDSTTSLSISTDLQVPEIDICPPSRSSTPPDTVFPAEVVFPDSPSSESLAS